MNPVDIGPLTDPQRAKAHYLALFRRNRAAILEAAALGFDRPIKGCPGWDVAALTGHMGRVYTFWLKWVRERPRGFSREAMAEIAADRDARLPGYTAWDEAGFPINSRPDGIVPFAQRAGDELDSAVVALEPEEHVWTFVPTHQTGAFVFRRLAMETTIHRWDAEEAHGITHPIPRTLAQDGIDEILMQFREDPAYDENRDRRHGQTLLLSEEPGGHLEAEDEPFSERCWFVTFDPSGITTAETEGPADVAIAGTASDLWLFIMGRRSPDEMRIEGNAELAASWGDLAGRF
jgi:uncharacterized protein (TIGR03083 family)